MSDWKHDGVQVIPGTNLDPNTAQTPGMERKAAIDFARVGAQKLWAGTVHIHPDAKTGAHHHGPLESVIYVVKGKARMRWGEHLEFTAEAGPGDFIYVPPYVPHQEINASPTDELECVLVRSDGEAVAINLDIEPIEKPETVLWIVFAFYTDCAALRITSTTRSGCESIGTWLESSSVVLAFMRFARKRSRSGLTV